MAIKDPIPELHMALPLKMALYAENEKRKEHKSAWIQGVLTGIRLAQVSPTTAQAIQIAIRDWTPLSMETTRASVHDITRAAHARRRQRKA